jgi:tetratricopeptide (TPR) repeat protein
MQFPDQQQERNIVSLNNRAAFFIKTERYKRGIESLVIALRKSEESHAMPREESDDDCSIDDCIEDKYCAFYSPPQEEQGASYNKNNEEGGGLEDDDDDDVDLFVYRKPIYIPKHAKRSRVMVSLIILYNMALANHLIALEEEDDEEDEEEETNCCKEQRLSKAFRLYELAYKLQLAVGDQAGTLFALFLLNNLGQIHKAMGNVNKSRQCFERVLSNVIILGEAWSKSDTLGEREQVMDNLIRTASQLLFGNNFAPAA